MLPNERKEGPFLTSPPGPKERRVLSRETRVKFGHITKEAGAGVGSGNVYAEAVVSAGRRVGALVEVLLAEGARPAGRTPARERQAGALEALPAVPADGAVADRLVDLAEFTCVA